MSIIDTWFDVYARDLLGRSIRSALVYDLLYKALGVALLTPIAAFILRRLIRTSGTVAITNEAIAEFLLSVPGLLFALLTSAFTLTSLYAELSGLMHIAARAGRGRHVGWAGALAAALSALPRLLHLALWQVGILLAWLLPLGAIAVSAYLTLLTEHDINWYLTHRPPALIYAQGIGAVLGATAVGVLSWYLLEWSLSIPVCLFEDQRGRAALRRGRELLRGHRPRALALLAMNLTSAGVLSALVLWLMDSLIEIALGAVHGLEARIAVTAAALLLLLLVTALISFLLLAVYAVVVLHLYLQVRGLDGIPARQWQRAAAAVRIPRAAILGLLAALLAGAFLLADNVLEGARSRHDVEVTAHRGSSRSAPENTLSALYQAISDGADYAEIDVQETADGVVVLLHDQDLMRIAGLATKVREAKFEDLSRVDAGRWFSPDFTGERIPTLKEALIAAGERIGLNIELKFNGHEQQLAERVVALVREVGCSERCILTSLDRQGLARVRELAPEIRIGQIVTAGLGDLTGLDVDLLSMNVAQVTRSRVRANRAARMEIHVWTVNEPEAMARMLDYGVDNIITDEPAKLRALIGERAALSDAELLLLALNRRLHD